MGNTSSNSLKAMDLTDVIRQQIRLGRKETTVLTKKGLEEIKKFGTEIAEEFEELIKKKENEDIC